VQNEKLAVNDMENEEIEREDEQPEVRPLVASDGQGRTMRTSTLTRRKERKGIELRLWPNKERIEATKTFLVDLYYQFEASIMKLMNDNIADHQCNTELDAAMLDAMILYLEKNGVDIYNEVDT
jgi:5'-3' exonuclease